MIPRSVLLGSAELSNGYRLPIARDAEAIKPMVVGLDEWKEGMRVLAFACEQQAREEYENGFISASSIMDGFRSCPRSGWVYDYSRNGYVRTERKARDNAADKERGERPDPCYVYTRTDTIIADDPHTASSEAERERAVAREWFLGQVKDACAGRPLTSYKYALSVERAKPKPTPQSVSIYGWPLR